MKYGYFLRNNEGEYVKSLDTENHELEFTKDRNKAKNYIDGQWFADTELEFLKFHFPEYKDKLDTMECKLLD